MSRMQEKINQPKSHQKKVYAGIDVSKNTLDYFIDSYGITRCVQNNDEGIRALVGDFQECRVDLAAIEATGKYHCKAHKALHETGVSVAVVNPFRSRQFAQSMGKLAKTDVIDAQTLARFAERMKPEPNPPAADHFTGLRELQTARRQVIKEIGDLKRQLQATDHALAIGQMRARLDLAEAHRCALETEIQALIDAVPDMKARFDILTSIPGIGRVTASVLIADLSELGRVNASQIAALAGVAPMNRDSGTRHGNRMIRGGRQSVRNALYMGAVSRVRRAGPLGAFYRRLIKRGKNPKVALTAVMRKMVIIANTLIAENRRWRPEAPPNA